MKKVIYIIALLIGATTMAQTITVNGTPMLVSDDISFPFWLESGSSISPEVSVSSISVLEFNIVPNNNGNDMVFNQVISVTEGQTVPEGKTWKVESVLMENQGFVNSDISNTNEIQNAEYIANAESGLHIKFYEPYYVSELSSVLLYADIQPGGGGSPQHGGFCYSTTNSSPDLNDDCIFDQNVAIGSQFYNSVNVGFDLIPDTAYYVRAFVSNNSGVTFSNTYQFETYQFYVGMSYQGGTIYYIDSTNLSGLIVSEELTPNYTMSCSNLVTLESFNSAEINTQVLRDNCSSGVFDLIDDSFLGYNDWFIPTIGDHYYLCDVLNDANGIYYSLNFGYMGQDIQVIIDDIEYNVKRPQVSGLITEIDNEYLKSSTTYDGNSFLHKYLGNCNLMTSTSSYPSMLIRKF